MESVWFRWLVWMDYRLAILFTVILPLIILLWAFINKADPIQRLMVIYWRVASLLGVTVYLMIAQYPVAFVSGILARILIPICLWFWVDLNDEIEYHPAGGLKLVFRSWRWAMSIYAVLGAIASLPFLSCAFSEATLKTSFCQVWLEAPLMYKDYFHANTQAGFLGFLGMAGLVFYILCLSYFVIFRLSKQGRSAIPQ